MKNPRTKAKPWEKCSENQRLSYEGLLESKNDSKKQQELQIPKRKLEALETKNKKYKEIIENQVKKADFPKHNILRKKQKQSRI